MSQVSLPSSNVLTIPSNGTPVQKSPLRAEIQRILGEILRIANSNTGFNKVVFDNVLLAADPVLNTAHQPGSEAYNRQMIVSRAGESVRQGLSCKDVRLEFGITHGSAAHNYIMMISVLGPAGEAVRQGLSCDDAIQKYEITRDSGAHNYLMMISVLGPAGDYVRQGHSCADAIKIFGITYGSEAHNELMMISVNGPAGEAVRQGFSCEDVRQAFGITYGSEAHNELRRHNPTDFINGFADFVSTYGQWASVVYGDLAPALITKISIWPQNATLIIKSDLGYESVFNQKEGNKIISLRQNAGGHYSYAPKNGPEVEVKSDGNCFYAALLKGLAEYVSSYDEGISQTLRSLTSPINTDEQKIQLLRRIYALEIRTSSDIRDIINAIRS